MKKVIQDLAVQQFEQKIAPGVIGLLGVYASHGSEVNVANVGEIGGIEAVTTKHSALNLGNWGHIGTVEADTLYGSTTNIVNDGYIGGTYLANKFADTNILNGGLMDHILSSGTHHSSLNISNFDGTIGTLEAFAFKKSVVNIFN